MSGNSCPFARILFALLLLNACSHAQTFDVIYDFVGGSLSGEQPETGLVADQAGNLYGTTYFGGSGCGTIFELSPPTTSGGSWTEQIIYSLDSAVGCFPNDLIIDAVGNVYGTAERGGQYGTGSAFELTPPVSQGGTWGVVLIVSFGTTNGQYPRSGLVMDRTGNLYGTTVEGGVVNLKNCGVLGSCGVVYELSPPAVEGGAWMETVLHKFQGGKEGMGLYGGLALDSNGNVYGTTSFGGGGACVYEAIVGCGTVFKLKRPSEQGGTWTEQILHRFQGGTSDGGLPFYGPTLDSQGNVYGTTFAGGFGACYVVGCGSVFRLSPPSKGATWSEEILFFFASPYHINDGLAPDSGVVLDQSGNLYGVTQFGGNYNFCSGEKTTCGVAFKLSPPTYKGGAWSPTALHEFSGGQDGFWPIGNPVFGAGGLLYGVASGGGDTTCSSGGCGVLFAVSP